MYQTIVKEDKTIADLFITRSDTLAAREYLRHNDKGAVREGEILE